ARARARGTASTSRDRCAPPRERRKPRLEPERGRSPVLLTRVDAARGANDGSPIQLDPTRVPEGMSDPRDTVMPSLNGHINEAACNEVPELGREAQRCGAEAEGSSRGCAACAP